MNEVFGRYQLVEKIAQGGMAEILLARPLSGTKNSCALKRILPQFSRDVQFVSMFIDEARITIGLNHPNIVQLYDFGQVDNIYFMAIEYVDGTDLAALLRNHVSRGEALPPIVAAFIVREVLAGLSHAHELKDARGRSLGVVHRDVSPQNVLVSTSGQVKITDFGIAAARHKLTLTSPGMVLGKAAYMAPEQAQGLPVDAATDLWAAGVILWESLAGQRLFADENPVATLQRVLGDDILLTSSLRPGIPRSLDDVVTSLLQRQRTTRARAADVVVAALDLVIAELAQTSPLAPNGVFEGTELAAWLATVEWTDDTAPMRPAALAHKQNTVSPIEVTARRVQKLSDDADLESAVLLFQKQQDPWILVDVGDRAVALGLPDVAVSAWRTAAAAFAFRGLLVQSLCAYSGVRRLCNDNDVKADVAALADLAPGKRDELDALLERFDRHSFSRSIARDDLPLPPKVPLLGSLGPRELAHLADVVTIRRVSKGDVILREGEPGDVLYAVGRGRFVVSCSPGDDSSSVPPPGFSGTPAPGELDWGAESTNNESGVQIDALVLGRQRVPGRVYLAGLADGDFFGEFSFLAERPRSATVEAVTDGVLLEIERSDVEHIAAVDPGFTAPLLNFYKERVVELMMAKSPVFSLLTPADRKALLDTALMLDVDDGDVIVAEGMRNDDLFFIKRGEVEVFRLDKDGISIFINKLGAGQFFGEVAALKKTPRTVSVRAIGGVSLFQIKGKALSSIVDKDIKLKALFEAMIQTRTRETQARVLEHTRLFFGT
ncbi:MAG: serine/threonine-protein kinase [Deltaproteobacteria bacterium]|nr:serine/threonine-protein kinase [Deltaproteobacteria bacterium]